MSQTSKDCLSVFPPSSIGLCQACWSWWRLGGRSRRCHRDQHGVSALGQHHQLSETHTLLIKGSTSGDRRCLLIPPLANTVPIKTGLTAGFDWHHLALRPPPPLHFPPPPPTSSQLSRQHIIPAPPPSFPLQTHTPASQSAPARAVQKRKLALTEICRS